jgi:hypothetical protein
MTSKTTRKPARMFCDRKVRLRAFFLGVVCLPNTAIGDDGKHLVPKGVAAEQGLQNKQQRRKNA